MDIDKIENIIGRRPSSHTLMFELFYPAVLGTIFYNLLPFIWDFQDRLGLSEPYVICKLLIGILILCHFAVDFLLARSIQSYNCVAFLIDGVVLFLLFKVFDSLNIPNVGVQISVRESYICYCAIFICYLFWTILERQEHTHLSRLVSFEMLAIFWFAFLSWWVPSPWVFACSILITTILLYCTVNWARKQP